jgi:UDP-N-acetylglucosamine 2-epimerase (non-hydrolysing)/GDP/UDP-N,N'-diacetylbacillosamine 2-epimerase (hydrolysing)
VYQIYCEKRVVNKLSRIRKVAVFTGNRAEYGLLFPVLRAIQKHSELEFKLIVSGAHLDQNFGSTLNEILNDGFVIESEIKIEMDASSVIATPMAIGSGILEISKVLKNLNPDLMVVYADRFEGFAAVIAATQMNIPTAHIEGGDITEGGALDDSVRHSMTKLSHIHFTTNEQATNRVLAMGEEIWRVHTVGFPAIDLITESNYATPEEIKKKYDLDINRPIVLYTQHSITTESEKAGKQVEPSIDALKKLATSGVQVVVTYANNDVGGKIINEKLEILKKQNFPNIQIQISLGRYFYHGILALARLEDTKIVCVGNSSSGLKETPVFGCPAVNIGSRQEGRLRGVNVLNVGYQSEEIYDAVIKCLYDEDFRKTARTTFNPYWLGDAGTKIANILASMPLGEKLLRKKMTLKGESRNGWFR